jgi:hypothetical protein
MSVKTNLTTDQRTLAPAVQNSGRPRSVCRIIGASLVAGGPLALVLILAVFAGGTEATITGSVLLGFGLGWALLADPVGAALQPTPAVGRRPGGRDECNRRGTAGLHAG